MKTMSTGEELARRRTASAAGEKRRDECLALEAQQAEWAVQERNELRWRLESIIEDMTPISPNEAAMEEALIFLFSELRKTYDERSF